MKWFEVATIVAVLWAVGGCDQQPSAPPGYSESPPGTQSDARPTTQELLSGAYKRIALAPLPLGVSAPQSWSVKAPTDTLYFLQGPTPSGEVQIQLGERASETSDKLDRLFKAARRDAEAHADTTTVDVRQLGNLKVFDVERIVIHDAANGAPPVPAATGPVRLMDWSVTYFLPRGSDFAAYELHFFNLSDDQFRADKDFLRKILDSVTPEEAGLGVGSGPGPK